MYKIINTENGAVLGITQEVLYIKRSPTSGCFVACKAKEAVGVAYQSEPYNLPGHSEIEDRPTVVVSEEDGGKLLEATDAREIQNAANIDYISMMTGVDLPEEQEEAEDGTQQEV